MLLRQNFRGRHERDVKTALEGHQRSATGHERFARTDITLQEPAHRVLSFADTTSGQTAGAALYTHKALRPDRTAAVTHVDGTSRVQTVSAEQNAYLYRIIEAFERRTGVPVLINTSFNLRGEPIVSSPSDALKTFFASGIDVLAIEDFLVEKQAAQ